MCGGEEENCIRRGPREQSRSRKCVYDHRFRITPVMVPSLGYVLSSRYEDDGLFIDV